MKQSFTKHIGKQQYLYIVLALIGMCFAGASLVFAEGDTNASAATQPRPDKILQPGSLPQKNLGTSTAPKPRMPLQQMENATDRTMRTATTTNVPAFRMRLENVPEDKRAMLEARLGALEEKRASFEERKNEHASTTAARKAEIETRMAERKAALGEQVQERIKMVAGNMANRFENVIATLENIITRIESRMTKLEERGVDTVEAAVLLEEAAQNLEEIKVLVAGLDTGVDYTVTSEQPREDWEAAKEDFRTVHELLKETRELLRQAVAAPKSAAQAAGLEGEQRDEPQDTI